MKVTLSLTITRRPRNASSAASLCTGLQHAANCGHALNFSQLADARTYHDARPAASSPRQLSDAHEIERQHGTDAAMDAVDSGVATWRTPASSPASYWTEGNARPARRYPCDSPAGRAGMCSVTLPGQLCPPCSAELAASGVLLDPMPNQHCATCQRPGFHAH